MIARSLDIRMTPPHALPVSVVIVARNEATNLARCVGSVRGWVDEVVVALNGTTDDSAAVVRSLGATVHELPWQGYRDTKNAALALARNEWALCLDADEEVSPPLRDALVGFLTRRDRDHHAGAQFARKVWFIDRWITHGDWYPDLSLRLIQRSRARWGGNAFVHEKMQCDGPVLTLAGDLHHYSFPTLSSHVAKINAFADLFLSQEQAKHTRFNYLHAIFRPAWRFFRAYVIRLGFLDGYPGFYIAWATAFATFVRYSRLFEAEHQQPRPRIPTDVG